MKASKLQARQTVVKDSESRTNRSDVAERAETLLRRNGHLFHQTISCEYQDGVLTLRGVVPSYYLKQVAQEVVASLEDVVQIDNRMEVPATEFQDGCGIEWTGMAPV